MNSKHTLHLHEVLTESVIKTRDVEKRLNEGGIFYVRGFADEAARLIVEDLNKAGYKIVRDDDAGGTT